MLGHGLFSVAQSLPSRPAGSVIDPSNALSSNLAGLFVMNEATGTTDKNLVDGQNASFSRTASPTWNTSDPSIVFNGGSSLHSYLNAGTDLTFDKLPISTMTVVAKVYVNSVSSAGIAEKNDGDTLDSGFVFGWDSTGALKLTVEKSSADMRVATAGGKVTSGQWMQVAFTWDGTAGNAAAAHLFINGVEQSKASSSDGSGNLGYSNATNQPLRIGNASFDFAGSLNGKIAYLAVYKWRILSTSEMNQLDSQLPITTDLVSPIVENGDAINVTTTPPGQNVQTNFYGWSSQQATVQISNNTIGAVTVSLLKPDETVLTSTSSSNSSFSLNTVTLPVTGPYNIVVHPTANTSGSVSVRLLIQGDPRSPASAIDSSNSLSTNMVGLFVMNEGSGTTDQDLVDSQAASFSGSSLPAWQALEPSILFNGGGSLNSYLNSGTDLTFDQLPTSKTTLVAKIFVNAVSAAGIAEKNDGNSVNSGFVFGWDSTGSLQLTVEKSSVNMKVTTAASTITTGQWIQVAFTWDGTIGNASAAHLFINGVEQSKTSSADGSGTLGYSSATNQPFRIGNASFDSARGSFNGKMAYLAVYRGRILSTTEMNQLDTQLPIQTVNASINTLTPSTGAVGSSIVIAGANFGSTQGNGTVTFNGAAATVTNWSGTSITATVPGGATTGNVVVTAGGISSNGVTFVVTPAPSVTSLTPNSGGPGASVVIAGANFGSSQGNGSVAFNGIPAAVANWGAAQVTTTVPVGATTGNVVVTAAGGVQSNGVAFTVLGPVITSVAPNAGAVGSSIVIAGSNFGPSQGSTSVTFNGTAATSISSWSSTSITAIVPAGATTGNLLVTVGGSASNAVTFTITGIPSITSVTPNAGAVGSSVVIAGSSFGSSQGNGSVTFNGTTATVISWNTNQITTTVPAAATTGNLIVTAAGGVQSNSVNFSVLPFIQNLNPNTGAAGTAVTISGSTFGSSAGTVTFNGVSATVSSWSNNSIVAVAPNGLANGNVVVTTAAGLASNGVFFALAGQVFSGPVTYSYDELGRLVGAVAASGDAVQYSYDPVGNITGITRFTAGQEALFSFTPRSGPVGTQVTISGANFSANGAQDSVSFNGTAAAINSASANSLLAAVPLGATTGPITVTSPNGSAASAESFTVTTSSSAPTITSFTPQIVAPGTAVTISGTNFDSNPANDRLLVNITSATTTTPASSTSLTMTTPSRAGSGHIYLTDGAGSTVSTGDLYIPPSIFTVSQVAATGRTTFGNSITASIPSNDVAMFLLDGVSGHRLSISVTSSNIGNCRLRLWAPDNSSLSPSDINCSGAGFIQPQTLPMTGTYALTVFAVNSTGSITLIPYDVPPDVSGTITVNGGETAVGTSTPGQQARLTFTGSANELITAVMDSSTYTNYFNVQGIFQIIAPDGTVVRSFNAPLSGVSWVDDVNYCTNNFTTYPCPSGPYVLLPSTGTYTLYLSPAGWSVGQLRIGLFGFASDVTTATTAGTATSPAIPVSMATAGQNARITFPVDMTQQQRVSFAFNGLSMSSVTGEFTPSVNFMVLDSTGVPIGGSNNSGQVFSYGSSTSSAYAEYSNNLTFQNSGTYTLWIDPVQDTTASLNVNVYDATDKSVTVAADGTSHSLTTTAPGQNFSFNFSGTQGQRVSAVISNLSGLTSPGLNINLLEQWNSQGSGSQDGSNYFIDTVTLGANDTYRIYIDPAGTDVGSATVTIYTVPADFSSTIDTVGDAVTVTTTTPGQNAQLTFTAPNPNMGLSLQMTNGTYPAGKCSATMSAPGGGGFNIGDCSGTTQTWNFTNIGPAGTYTININPLLSATGSATFSVTLH
jgi:YD repeat-containing protein